MMMAFPGLALVMGLKHFQILEDLMCTASPVWMKLKCVYNAHIRASITKQCFEVTAKNLLNSLSN